MGARIYVSASNAGRPPKTARSEMLVFALGVVIPFGEARFAARLMADPACKVEVYNWT
jgi:hypothetical protein